MNEKALTVYQPVTPVTWDMISAIAPTIWRAGMFGVGSTEAAAAIMLKGHELGLGLTASFEFIHIIQNKPTLSPRGALALIQRSGLLAELEIEDLADKDGPTRCRVRMKRENGFEYTVEYSMKDAGDAGLVKDGSGWKKYPANMLRWRAIGFCADVVFPDVIGGMRRADEFGAEIDEGGDVLAGPDWQVLEVIENHRTPVAESRELPSPAEVLQQLVTEYGAEAVMAANDGRIPTEDEVEGVAERLGADG